VRRVDDARRAPSALFDAMPSRAVVLACACAVASASASAVRALSIQETFDDGALTGWTHSREAKYGGAWTR